MLEIKQNIQKIQIFAKKQNQAFRVDSLKKNILNSKYQLTSNYNSKLKKRILTEIICQLLASQKNKSFGVE